MAATPVTSVTPWARPHPTDDDDDDGDSDLEDDFNGDEEGELKIVELFMSYPSRVMRAENISPFFYPICARGLERVRGTFLFFILFHYVRLCLRAWMYISSFQFYSCDVIF